MGILWITIAQSNSWLEPRPKGIPSINAWRLKLIKINQGIFFAKSCEWTCPCSAPLEKNSNIVCKTIQSNINNPICFFCVSKTSGSKYKTVIESKYAPLNDKNKRNNLVLGFNSRPNPNPTRTDVIKVK